MTTKQLSKEDNEALALELMNSTTGRQQKLRRSYVVSSVALLLTVTFYYLDLGRLTDAAFVISLTILTIGIFNIVSWAMFSKSIRIFKTDINQGVKHVGELEISSYNLFTRKIRLDDGTTLDSFEINYDWKRGDRVYVEKLPVSGFILRCERKRVK